MKITQSQDAFEAAKTRLVGGVNSPVRAFKAVGGTPLFFESGKGAYLYSVDEESYIDYVLSWGPLLAGHAHPKILEAISKAAAKGTSFGAPTRIEATLAEQIQVFYPHMQKIRMVCSGTEAGMSVIRLARGATGRSIILKFKGCYHGHADALLVSMGSGGLTFGVPNSAGVLEDTAKHTLELDFNDSDGVKALFESIGPQIAGVIVEPVAGNMGLILPKPGFLETLRQCCDAYRSILIFDEVMCGFRSQKGSTTEWTGVTPDLVMLGKVIGGGLPAAAYGGKSEIMAYVSPEGPVYQAGTLSGNPLAMAAGKAMLELIEKDGVFESAAEKTDKLTKKLAEVCQQHPLFSVGVKGSMWGIYATKKEILNREDIATSNIAQFNEMYHRLLQRGIYLPPSAYEACFMSSEHGYGEIEKTVEAFAESI